MWLYIIALVVLIFGIVGGALSGGIFTIIFIPIGALILLSAVAHGMWGRAEQGRQGAAGDGSQTPGRPLPASRHSNTPATPDTPEQLADARRAQQ
jgi:hypothetical protein